MNHRIALIVDNPYRDLPGLVLLAVRLCQEGATCFLVPFNLRVPELLALAPDFVLLNYLRRPTEGLAHNLANLGVKLGVLDTEGGVFESGEGNLVGAGAYRQTMVQDQQLRHKISCFCTGGPRLSKIALEENWYKRSQVEITGCPRFDFYVDPWRKAALRSSQDLDQYGRSLVLFNGNFPLANSRFASQQKYATALEQKYGFDAVKLRAVQKSLFEALVEMAELVNRLARKFPQTNFVYRPHPFERLETYEKLLDKRSNLHLVKMGTVDIWILRAQAVVQRSCATAIEAGMAGVPALSPQWIEAGVELPAAEAVSVACSSEADIMEKLHDILNNQFAYPASVKEELSKIINEWFYRVDGQAHERVASAIMNRIGDNKGRVNKKECLNLLYRDFKKNTSRRDQAGSWIRKNLGLPVQWSFRQRGIVDHSEWWDRSEKSFDHFGVQQLAEAICDCAEGFSPVQVRLAHESGEYLGDYLGRTVAVSPQS